jgi:TRAP-type mannitol/chloroaromatic compound transport system permease large subunit
MGDLYWSALPFIALQFIAIVLVVIFPEIVTWLPNALFG